MRFELNNAQRTVLVLAATAIVFVQFAIFDDDGFRGSGWVWAFVAAAGLLYLAFSTKPGYTPLNTSAPLKGTTTRMPSKEELDAAHAQLRENAEVLFLELERRAGDLCDVLVKEKNKDFSGLSITVQGSKEKGASFNEGLNLFIAERCHLLMLALVGMRRSKGNELYITGLEFRTLQELVGKKLVQYAVRSHQVLDADVPLNPEAIAKQHLGEILQVRKHIVDYCVATKRGDASPETALITSFENQGLRISDISHVRNTLVSED